MSLTLAAQWARVLLIDAALAAGVKLWHVTTNGTDHVDVAYFLEKGLPLANSPGRLSAVPLAEHVIMLILCFAKDLKHNRADGWQRAMGEELAGKKLGLIGFGASAREVARRAWPLGMRIMAIDVVAFPQAELDEFHVEFLGGPEQMDDVLGQADYLSLHVHLNANDASHDRPPRPGTDETVRGPAQHRPRRAG